MKHTKGPWTVRHNGKSWTVRGDDELVTKIEDLNSSSQSNANLISAAPEIAAAAEQLLLRLEALEDEKNMSDEEIETESFIEHEVNELKIALKKARGN